MGYELLVESPKARDFGVPYASRNRYRHTDVGAQDRAPNPAVGVQTPETYQIRVLNLKRLGGHS